MRYADIKWTHDLQSEPVRFWIEIDDNDNVLRQIEEYASGALKWDSVESYDFDDFPVVSLSSVSFPSEDEYEEGSNEECSCAVFTRLEFSRRWSEATSNGSRIILV